MIIVSVMDRDAGFYSLFFFAVYNYLRCQKQGVGFRLDTQNWLFKAKHGWTDYFQEVVDLPDTQNPEDTTTLHYFTHQENLRALPLQFTQHEYRAAILNTLYRYNDVVQQTIQQTKQRLGLTSGEYDAIFIRRGDKLCSETLYIPTEVYMNNLLQKHPTCHTVFLQTDDYNAFLDIQSYIQTRGLAIRVVTLCSPEHRGGMVVFRRTDDKMRILRHDFATHPHHASYFHHVVNHLRNTRSVDEMTPTEIYTHTMDMLVGVDIVLHSQHTVLDGQSNVSRFISIVHDQPSCVVDVRCPNTPFDMNSRLCPAFETW